MIHYVNIGLPKTGTTWLYKNLKRSTEIDYNKAKEPPVSLLADQNQYCSYFSGYTNSVNFQTNLWKIDYDQMTFLKTYASHISIILRNPYTYANSMYNFHNSKNEHSEYINSIKQYLDYTEILKRWQTEKLKVFFYDDICNNPQDFMDKITSYIGIDPIKVHKEHVNVTRYYDSLIFDNNTKDVLNYYIIKLENFLDLDLKNWYIGN